MRLDVRVLDAQGHPVRDLRADEIEVIEEGQSRPILLFQHIEEPSGPYEDVARRTIAGEVSTNQGAPRGHLYVLIFDQHHIETGHEQRARIAAERFLRTRVGRGDRVALYALPGPGPQIDFTGNVDRAASELIRVRGSLERVSPGRPRHHTNSTRRTRSAAATRRSSRASSTVSPRSRRAPTRSRAVGVAPGSPAQLAPTSVSSNHSSRKTPGRSRHARTRRQGGSS